LLKFAALERAQQGKRTCNYALGYDVCGKDTFAINVREAEIVRCIYAWYQECRNFTSVAERCRVDGWTGKQGKPLRAESVKKILTRPLYAGYNSFKGRLYRGSHPSIISVEKYNQVQRLLHKEEI
jgi:site-specific DNA recombinase